MSSPVTLKYGIGLWNLRKVRTKDHSECAVTIGANVLKRVQYNSAKLFSAFVSCRRAFMVVQCLQLCSNEDFAAVNTSELMIPL